VGHGIKFISHPEGYIEPNNQGSFDYVFQYKDHLGNIRLSYSDKNNDGQITASTEIIEENNYYPFGLEHKGYNNVVTSTNLAQNYTYNGKEKQEELGLNWHDFGARNYQADLGRWMNIDPLAEMMPRHSTYSYAFNNPLSFVDRDGLYPEPILRYHKGSGTYRFTNAASHLLSLVSGVNKRQIQNAVIQPRAIGQYRPFYSANEGGGAITLGSPNYYTITYTENWFEDEAYKYKSKSGRNTSYGQNILAWLSLSSHEVGHIPQINREGGLWSYIGEFISQYATAGNHDDAKYEEEAEVGQTTFNEFNNFINKEYGANSLVNLFENHTENVITRRLDKWWKAFEDDRSKKEERTDSFIKGLSTNLDNYSEGTYIWNGDNWVKKN